MTILSYAAQSATSPLAPLQIPRRAPNADDVVIDILYCGVCHSDLHTARNDWKNTIYPVVPGHEIIGTIQALGSNVNHLKIGQRVGLGWFSSSCMVCPECLSGSHNLCGKAEGVLVGRFGGFADTVRAHKIWAIPLPEGIDPEKAGPLFCGGITVFNPIIQHRASALSRVGVVGVGGLGHLAVKFLKAWGAEVTAFSSTPEKEKEALAMGAHHFANSRDAENLEKLTAYFDLIIVTVNVDLNWPAYISMLAPKGVLHFAGAVHSFTSNVFPLIGGQKSISGSPLGSPAAILNMLDFCRRHHIEPITETYPLSKVNDAIEKLKSGNARYRLILKSDF